MVRRTLDARRYLATLPLFAAAEPAALERLAAATTRRPLARGERVFSAGDAPTGMYVLVFGRVRLLQPVPGRAPRLVGEVEPGRSFGEPVMFLGRPALVDAEAASDALVLHLPREAVFAEIERDPAFARRMIAGLSGRIESLVLQEQRRARGGGSARLADYLLHQAAGGPQPVVTLPASKASVAAHLHLTPEHLSRLLHGLAAAGVLRVEGRTITVLDAQALRRSAAQE